MRIFTLHRGDKLVIGDNVVITPDWSGKTKVHLLIEAPRSTNIRRGELKPREEQYAEDN